MNRDEALSTVIGAAMAWARIWRDIEGPLADQRIAELDDAVDVLRYGTSDGPLYDPAELAAVTRSLTLHRHAPGPNPRPGIACRCGAEVAKDHYRSHQAQAVLDALRVVRERLGCEMDRWAFGEGMVECGKSAVDSFMDLASGRRYRVCAEHDAKLGPKLTP